MTLDTATEDFVSAALASRTAATHELTPAEARAKVQEYIDRGCTCPILYPMSDPQLMIDTFAVQP